MISKNIRNLIDKYNEDGIFMRCDLTIYWFNGKRFEYWVKTVRKWPVFTYQHDLYCNFNGTIMIYKNKEFKFVEKHILLYNHPIKYFGTMAVCKEQYLFTLNYRSSHLFLQQFDGITNINFEKPIFSAHQMLLYLDDIYIFGGFKCEKFNIMTKKWLPFADMPFVMKHNIFDSIYLFNGIFYLEKNKKLYSYNPNIDQWSSNFMEPNK